MRMTVGGGGCPYSYLSKGIAISLEALVLKTEAEVGTPHAAQRIGKFEFAA
jgi:hypothetical protein